jgi:hypothetical protein
MNKIGAHDPLSAARASHLRRAASATAIGHPSPLDAAGQVAEDQGGPVVLINEFNVDPGDVDQLVKAWAADAAVMQREPGYMQRGTERSSSSIL